MMVHGVAIMIVIMTMAMLAMIPATATPTPTAASCTYQTNFPANEHRFDFFNMSIWSVTNSSTGAAIPVDQIVPPSSSSYIIITSSAPEPTVSTTLIISATITVQYITVRNTRVRLNANVTFASISGVTISDGVHISGDDITDHGRISFGTYLTLTPKSVVILKNVRVVDASSSTIVGTTVVRPASDTELSSLVFDGTVIFDSYLMVTGTADREVTPVDATITVYQMVSSTVVYGAPATFTNIQVSVMGDARVSGDITMVNVWSMYMMDTARVINEYQRYDGTMGHSSWTVSATPIIVDDAQCLDGLQSIVSLDNDDTPYTKVLLPSSITIAVPQWPSQADRRAVPVVIQPGSSEQIVNYLRLFSSPTPLAVASASSSSSSSNGATPDPPQAITINYEVRDTARLITDDITWSGAIHQSVLIPEPELKSRRILQLTIDTNRTFNMVNASVTSGEFTLSRVDGTLRMDDASLWTLRNGAVLFANGSRMVNGHVHFVQQASNSRSLLIFGNATDDVITVVNASITAVPPTWSVGAFIINGRVIVGDHSSFTVTGTNVEISSPTVGDRSKPGMIELPAGGAQFIARDRNWYLDDTIQVFVCDAANTGGVVIDNPSGTRYGLFAGFTNTLPPCIYRFYQPVVQDLASFISAFPLNLAGSTLIASNRIAWTSPSTKGYTISPGGSVTIIAPNNGGMNWTNGLIIDPQRQHGDHTVIFDRCTSVTFTTGGAGKVSSSRFVWQRIAAHDTNSGACATPTIVNFNQQNQPAVLDVYEPIELTLNGGGYLAGDYTNHYTVDGAIARQGLTMKSVISNPYTIYSTTVKFANWNLNLNTIQVLSSGNALIRANNTAVTCTQSCIFTSVDLTSPYIPTMYLDNDSSYTSMITSGGGRDVPPSPLFLQFIIDPTSSVHIDGMKITGASHINILQGNGMVEMGPSSRTMLDGLTISGTGQRRDDQYLVIKSLPSSVYNWVQAKLTWVSLQLMGSHTFLASTTYMDEVDITLYGDDQVLGLEYSCNWYRTRVTYDASCHRCAMMTHGGSDITTMRPYVMNGVTIDMSASRDGIFVIDKLATVTMTGRPSAIITSSSSSSSSSSSPIQVVNGGQLSSYAPLTCHGDINVTTGGSFTVAMTLNTTVDGSVTIDRASSLTFVVYGATHATPSLIPPLSIINPSGVLRIDGTIKVTLDDMVKDVADGEYILATGGTIITGAAMTTSLPAATPYGAIFVRNNTLIYRPGGSQPDNNKGSSGSHTGMIVGIVIGSLVGIAIIGVCIRRRHQQTGGDQYTTIYAPSSNQV